MYCRRGHRGWKPTLTPDECKQVFLFVKERNEKKEITTLSHVKAFITQKTCKTLCLSAVCKLLHQGGIHSHMTQIHPLKRDRGCLAEEIKQFKITVLSTFYQLVFHSHILQLNSRRRNEESRPRLTIGMLMRRESTMDMSSRRVTHL